MRLAYLLIASLLTVAAQNRGMSVDELYRFLQSEAQLHHPDKEVAGFLKQSHLRERLDEDTIEKIKMQFVPGPQTMAALKQLAEQSKSLPEAKAVQSAPTAEEKPAPSPEEQQTILSDVRQFALDYTKNLPDFLCIQKEVRYGARAAANPDWHKIDELDTRLTYFEQREDYKPFLHNNKPVSGRDIKSFGGSQSFGDFGSMLREIMDPVSRAEFTWVRWSVMQNRHVMVFRYRVTLENSRYQIYANNNRSLTTAYHGEIAVEVPSRKVLQVSMTADNIPPDFPVTAASDVLTYDYQEISGKPFLLPYQAIITMNGEGEMTRNEKLFVGYQKYSADATITFK